MPETRIDKGEYVVIIEDASAKPSTPLFCPVCELAMSTRADVVSYARWTCCEWCVSMWVDGREERWRCGWRPTAEQLDATLRGLGMRR